MKSSLRVIMPISDVSMSCAVMQLAEELVSLEAKQFPVHKYRTTQILKTDREVTLGIRDI